MIKTLKLYVVVLSATILFTGCEALLKAQANTASKNMPERAYTIPLPPNNDRIATTGYAPGSKMNPVINTNGTRYKDYILQDFDVQTEYYKRNAPNWNKGNSNLIVDIISPKNDVVKNRPCLVFLFGGGFVGKFDDCTGEICKGFVQKGYVVASADYRVGFENGLLAGQCVGDFNTGMYPAYVRAIQDARSLVRYLKANAERLGINPNLIFVSGQSAGALTALGIALVDDNDIPKEVLNQVGGTLDPMKDNMQFSSEPAGVISLAGAVINPLIGAKTVKTPVMFIGGTCDELIDLYKGTPFRCKEQRSYPFIYGSGAIYEAMKDKNSMYFNMICNGAHGMGSVGYLNLISLMSNYTYSILQGNPLTGKKIIPAEKGVCNNPDLCK